MEIQDTTWYHNAPASTKAKRKRKRVERPRGDDLIDEKLSARSWFDSSLNCELDTRRAIILQQGVAVLIEGIIDGR